MFCKVPWGSLERCLGFLWGSLSHNVDRLQRLKLLRKIVIPTLTYAVETQQVSADQLKKLDSVFNDMVSRIFAFKRDRTLPWLSWRIENLRNAKNVIQRANIKIPSFVVGESMWRVACRLRRGTCLGR